MSIYIHYLDRLGTTVMKHFTENLLRGKMSGFLGVAKKRVDAVGLVEN